MSNFESTVINGKEYRFKRPVLGIVRKNAGLERYLLPKKPKESALQKIFEEESAWKEFEREWKTFSDTAFEEKLPELDEVTLPEALRAIAVFFALVSAPATASESTTSQGSETTAKAEGSGENTLSSSSSTDFARETSQSGDG